MQEDAAELIQEMREVGKDNTRVKEQNLLFPSVKINKAGSSQMITRFHQFMNHLLSRRERNSSLKFLGK